MGTKSTRTITRAECLAEIRDKLEAAGNDQLADIFEVLGGRDWNENYRVLDFVSVADASPGPTPKPSCATCRFGVRAEGHQVSWLECTRHAPIIIPSTIIGFSGMGYCGYFPKCSVPCGDYEWDTSKH